MRLQISGTRAIQYFRLIVCRACACSSGGKIRACAINSGPVTLPRMVQGATFTCGLLRTRFVFPISLRVITYSLSPSSPNQTGVATPVPFLRKVVKEIYFWPCTGAGIMFTPARKEANCPHASICVTSVGMRKWMRERLQRRKKKAVEPSDKPAPAPLQPAYFDAESVDSSADQTETAESQVPEPQGVEAPSFETPSHQAEAGLAQPAVGEERPQSAPTPSVPSSGRAASANRSRRRRGGRGRGAPGREQAVANAFTPAGLKGSISSTPAESPDEESPAADAESAAVTPAHSRSAQPASAPRPPKGIVVLAIGLPGSGKSSWFKRHNVVPLSSDMVRTLLFDDVREQRYQDLVFSNLRSMLKARLVARRPMNYVDATNLTPKEREHWIKLARDYNYEVHAVFFDVPLEVCIERHHRRDRVVPDDVMRRMAAKLKPPTFEEGFAKITVVRVKKKPEEAAGVESAG